MGPTNVELAQANPKRRKNRKRIVAPNAQPDIQAQFNVANDEQVENVGHAPRCTPLKSKYSKSAYRRLIVDFGVAYTRVSICIHRNNLIFLKMFL